ncbi:MAG TPA: UDP-N-acetylglucosamine 2-epimerase (non-hydrolyzing) [bacterium]|nr:UDP-N-acetylglucosamine 2-epimerase (non-hydrolyzing) [bacterium]
MSESCPTVCFILGTRPEAIKCAPVIRAMREEPGLRIRLLVTSQHRELQDSVLDLFDLKPDWDLNIMQREQDLPDVIARLWQGICGVFAQERPDLVIVQGDTSSAFIGGLAAAFHRIPVGHIEAGLRTYRDDMPFPEEIQRRLLSPVTRLHFAPTEHARQNLLDEGVSSEQIYVVGNPGVDAFLEIAGGDLPPLDPRVTGLLGEGRKILLTTIHRREHWGETLGGICQGIHNLLDRNRELVLVHLLHPNPTAQRPFVEKFSDCACAVLLPAQPYAACLAYLKEAYLVMTDSGGIQEEAPYFGKPLLVLREKTERPEGIEAGAAYLAGVDPDAIVRQAERILHNPSIYDSMAQKRAPYGDGKSAVRITEIVQRFLTARERA